MMRVTDWSNLNQTPIFLLRRRSHKASTPCPSRLVAPIRLRGWISSDDSCFEKEGIDKFDENSAALDCPKSRRCRHRQP